MRSLDDILKELEELGFRLLYTRVYEGMGQTRMYVRSEGKQTASMVSLTTLTLPPEDEEDEEEEEEQMVYSQEEMEFIREELSSHYPSSDVIFWLEVMPDIPRWLRDKVLKRREVMQSDEGEQPKSG